MRSIVCGFAFSFIAMAVEPVSVAIRLDPAAGAPAQNAIRVLKNSLQRRGVPARTILTAPDRTSREVLVEVVIATGGARESFSIQKSAPGKPAGIVVRAPDDVGLAYGVYELGGQIENTPAGVSVYNAAAGIAPTPEIAKRGMTVFLYNRDLESEWLYDTAYWERYFELLARSRFNYFTLVFGHQTSYMAPPFPFLIAVPGYERVKVPSLSSQERARSLEMLRTISAMAEQWGIRFILGVWQQHAYLYGRNLVEGLSYEDLFDYCPKALELILKACPKIYGVQFRMNSESGIEEDDQNRFYTGMARAIRSVGWPIAVDFRAKGLRPETIDSSLALGIRPIVSTKYWREHMGLPFHGTRIDPDDKSRSYRRYGYWDLLYQGRPYDVACRMWTLGSTKLLLWGSLNYAQQFARSSKLGDSLGFDVCAPLSQKGFGNWAGGNWRIFGNPELEYYRWEFERYWAYYLSFGLGAIPPRAASPYWKPNSGNILATPGLLCAKPTNRRAGLSRLSLRPAQSLTATLVIGRRWKPVD